MNSKQLKRLIEKKIREAMVDEESNVTVDLGIVRDMLAKISEALKGNPASSKVDSMRREIEQIAARLNPPTSDREVGLEPELDLVAEGE